MSIERDGALARIRVLLQQVDTELRMLERETPQIATHDGSAGIPAAFDDPPSRDAS